MTESTAAPGVALLFADADLCAHLRESLVALGARIVYEGAATQVEPDTLVKSGADVVVVNLEPDENEDFERLYAILDQGSHRVVFNDPEVSHGLSGWDKARWARHLAVKLLGSGDVDPPRPADARQIESGHAETSSNQAVAQADDVDTGATVETLDVAEAPDDATSMEKDSAQSELMSAELEAMLVDESDDGAGTTPAHAGDGDAGQATDPVVDVEERQTESAPAPVTDWELVDVDAAPPVPEEREDASRFGIEKVNAADYLKPEGEGHASPIEPGLELELVSLEESVSPSMFDDGGSEVVLDSGERRIGHVVLVGAGHDATIELGEFLAGLPETLPALVLVVQHQQDQSAGDLAGALDTSTRLPVRVAEDGAVAREGEAWLVPAGRFCRMVRQGRMSLETFSPEVGGNPSIDRCFETLIDTFGADATAIVLAGDGRDGLAGVQHVADHAGRVWIQDPAASGTALAAHVREAGLDTFSGSPTELARHLVEDFA